MNAEDLTYRRVTKPPGGEDSDIFGVRGVTPSNADFFQSPRKVKNYQQSTIFAGASDDEPSTPSSGSGASTPTRRRLSTNSSQERLFGADIDYNTPKRVIDRMKSNIFTDSPDSGVPAVPVSASKKFISRNPITGDVYQVGPMRKNSISDGYSSNGSTSPVDGARSTTIY